jgi:hypothetical protein
LVGLVYRSDSNFNGLDTLVVSVSDYGNSGVNSFMGLFNTGEDSFNNLMHSSVTLSDTVNLPLFIHAVNDAPVIILSVPVIFVNEDESVGCAFYIITRPSIYCY